VLSALKVRQIAGLGRRHYFMLQKPRTPAPARLSLPSAASDFSPVTLVASCALRPDPFSIRRGFIAYNPIPIPTPSLPFERQELFGQIEARARACRDASGRANQQLSDLYTMNNLNYACRSVRKTPALADILGCGHGHDSAHTTDTTDTAEAVECARAALVNVYQSTDATRQFPRKYLRAVVGSCGNQPQQSSEHSGEGPSPCSRAEGLSFPPPPPPRVLVSAYPQRRLAGQARRTG
jgi:hypothetical protein